VCSGFTLATSVTHWGNLLTISSHILFAFDHYSDESPETQIEIVLPDVLTRTPEFKKDFFSIR
jgi:hypothetical protein